MTIKITRAALDSGKIVHTGWTLGRDVAERCGVNVADYFDSHGNFLGVDENGLAPTFAEIIMSTGVTRAIKRAKVFAVTEGGKWCVVERRDPESGVFEYAVAPVGVACDDNESVVWSM